MQGASQDLRLFSTHLAIPSAVPRVIKVGAAGGGGSGKAIGLGDAGGKDAFISPSEVPDAALLSKYF